MNNLLSRARTGVNFLVKKCSCLHHVLLPACLPCLFPFNMVEGTWKYQKQKPRSQRNRPENLWRPKNTKQKRLMETTKQILLWLLLLKPRRNERLALQRDLERPWLPKGSAAGASEFWKFSNQWCSRREIYLKIYVIFSNCCCLFEHTWAYEHLLATGVWPQSGMASVEVAQELSLAWGKQ